ncbi:MAG: hypothetical protein ABIL58_07945 [Pseudomonadota bacterium]
MSFYSAGTVSIANGSAVVIGNGTAFLSNVAIGQLFKVKGIPATFEVQLIADDTHLTLDAPWSGSNQVDVEYIVAKDFTPTFGLPLLAVGMKDWVYWYNLMLAMVDTALATGSVAEGVTNGNAHDHSGGDGGQISHAALSAIGSNSHAQIDAFIGSRAAANGLATLDANGNLQQLPGIVTATPTANAIALATASAKLDAWVSVASETVPGIVERASLVEALAKTDQTRHMTPYTSAALITQEISSQVIAGAPAALNTLDKLAASIGDNAAFAATMTTALSGKSATGHTHVPGDITNLTSTCLALAGGTMTGHQYFDDGVMIKLGTTQQADFYESSDWTWLRMNATGLGFAITDTTTNYLMITKGTGLQIRHSGTNMRLRTSAAGMDLFGIMAVQTFGDVTAGLTVDGTAVSLSGHTHDDRYFTETEVNQLIADLVASAPGTLDTLNELAAALGDDPNFATTVTNLIAGKSDTSHTHATLYAPLAHVGATGTAHGNATGSVAGFMTADDFTKLAGIEASANNYSHPAAHAISFITGLQTALDGKAPTHTHPYRADSWVPAWTDVTSKPSTFPPSEHSHTLLAQDTTSDPDNAYGEGLRMIKVITNPGSSATMSASLTSLAYDLQFGTGGGYAGFQFYTTNSAFANSGDLYVRLANRVLSWRTGYKVYHAGNLLAATGIAAGLMSAANFTKLSGIATGANLYVHPAAHVISEVTGLQDELDGKAATHTHPYRADSWVPTWSDVTDKPSVFTPDTHVHSAADLTSGVIAAGARIGSGTSGFLKYAAGTPTWAAVTKSDVGLGSVENTALSTWAGSGNITTIGTLSAGTVPWTRLSGVPSSFAPASHAHGNIANGGTVGSTANLPLITGTSGIIQAGSFGTAAATFCQGNDSRLSDARTPLSHTLLGHTVSGLTIGHFLKATGAGTFAFAAHGLTKSDVGLGSVENTALSTWAGSSYITAIGTLSSGSVPWARLSGIPSTFTPSAHAHAISDVTGLQTALDGKAATHSHPYLPLAGGTLTADLTMASTKKIILTNTLSPSIMGDPSGALNITTPSGYVLIGPQSTSYCHFGTDRAGYYFDKAITVTGNIITTGTVDGIDISAHAGGTGAVHGNATGSVAGFMTTADFSKLAGIAAGANNYTHPATHGNITSAGLVGTTANLPLITGTGGIVQAGAFGTAINTFCQGNDARLSDARTPVSHALTGHTVSGLTAGHVLKATGATTFGFASISKSDIGLGSVENTALSTWAGSSNITAIGTLASGTVPWARLSSVPSYLLLSGGTMTGNPVLNDGVMLGLGTDVDAQLYASADWAWLRLNAGASGFAITDGTKSYLAVSKGYGVELFYDGVNRLYTRDFGAKVSGRLEADNIAVSTGGAITINGVSVSMDGHAHTGYAATDHTHTGYAATDHSHTLLAQDTTSDPDNAYGEGLRMIKEITNPGSSALMSASLTALAYDSQFGTGGGYAGFQFYTTNNAFANSGDLYVRLANRVLSWRTGYKVFHEGNLLAATSITAGLMSAANFTKLSGIATGANLYVHPAAHAISEVTGLQTALDGKAPTHSHLYRADSWLPTWDDVTGKPSTFTPAAHVHSASDLTSGAISAGARLGTGSSGFLKYAAGTPTWAAVTKSDVGLGSVENTALSTWAGSANITTVGTLSAGTIPWARLSNVPSTFAPSAHAHAISEVTGLQTALDGKAATHTHPYLTEAYLSTKSLGDANAADAVGITTYYLTSAATNRPTGTDHALLTLSYSAVWSTQMAADWRTNEWYVRNQNNGTWGAWANLWHSGNFTPSSKADVHAHPYRADSWVPTWDNVTGKPTTFTPASHTLTGHTASGLTAGHVLRATGAAAFSFGALQASDLPSHAHAIADVIGLQTALDGKLATTSKAADSSLLNGAAAATAATVSTIVKRDSNGDVWCRYLQSSYLNMTHAAAVRASDTVFYSSTDAYIRKNTAAGFRSSLDVYSTGEAAANFLPMAGVAADSDKLDGLHAASFIRSDSAATFNANVTIANAYTLSIGSSGGMTLEPGYARLASNLYIRGPSDTNVADFLSGGYVYLYGAGTKRFETSMAGVVVSGTLDVSGSITLTGTVDGVDISAHAGGTGAVHGNATASVAGFMTAADFTKLGGIATGANLYSHPAAHGNITSAGLVGTTANLPLITGTGGIVQASSFGTAANTFCQGNDSRLSDARTPTTHAHSAADFTSGVIAAGARLGSGSSGFLKYAAGSPTWSTIAAVDLPTAIDAAKIANGAVSNTEFQYLDGVTSAIQTQLNGKSSSTHTHALIQIQQPSSNLTAQGTYSYATTGEAYSAGDLLCRGTDGRHYKAQASVASRMPCVAIAMEASTAAAQAKQILNWGYFRNDGWTGATIGNIAYVSTTAGAMTHTKPTTTGHLVQVLGQYETTNICLFNPCLMLIELT